MKNGTATGNAAQERDSLGLALLQGAFQIGVLVAALEHCVLIAVKNEEALHWAQTKQAFLEGGIGNCVLIWRNEDLY